MKKGSINSWADRQSARMDAVERFMAEAILVRAIMIAPRDTGALIESGRVEKMPDGGYNVIFGGGDVPYARRRHFENNKNPQTLHYLSIAGDSVASEPLSKWMALAGAL